MPRICQPINVLKLTNVSIVRYKDGANTFELACYPNKVRDWREGKECDTSEVLQSDRIFTCVNKGQFARDAELVGSFGTTDFATCVKKILSMGDVQMAAQERKVLQRNFQQEVFTLATARLTPLNARCALHVDTVKQMAHDAGVCPKMKRDLPPKAAASLLVQNLVRAYPKELGLFARHVRVTFADAAAARKCYADLLRQIGAFAIVHQRQPGEEGEQPEGAKVTLEVYISEQNDADLELYCRANNVEFQILDLLTALPVEDCSTSKTLPAVLQVPVKQQKLAGAPEKAAEEEPSVSSDDDVSESSVVEIPSSGVFGGTRSRKADRFDLLAEDSPDPVTVAALEDSDLEEVSSDEPDIDLQILNKDRRELLQEHKLKEKKVRSKERKVKEQRKLDDLAHAAIPAEPKVIVQPTDYTDADAASPTWCKACRIDFAKALSQNIRQHTKMEWHVFNQKRFIRNQPPVTFGVFEELSKDVKDGFLAIQH